MPRFRRTVPIDDYVLDVLIYRRARSAADRLPGLPLSSGAARQHWQPVKSSLRMLADETGLSKSAVQTAIAKLQDRQLIKTSRSHRTAVPLHRVLRHWRSKRRGSSK
jgi:hypothetical protein